MENFENILKDQENNLRKLNPNNYYETKVLNMNNIKVAVLLTKESNGHCIKSAYLKLPNKDKIDYIGFQADNNNDKIYPYGNYSKKILQDILWNVGCTGYLI